MPRRLPPGCIEDRDRHGNLRIYLRAKGRAKVRIRGTPFTPEFMAEYEAAKGGAEPTQRKGITPGTWRWLCVRYFAECADYLRLDARTKRVRRGILEATFDEPITPGLVQVFSGYAAFENDGGRNRSFARQKARVAGRREQSCESNSRRLQMGGQEEGT